LGNKACPIKKKTADNPRSMYKIVQTIGKTMDGGVSGDCFKLEYQVLFLVFRFPEKSRLVIAFPMKGCRIRNMKKIILPIISFYFIKYFNFLDYERIHF
jgi:hypothetical protein